MSRVWTRWVEELDRTSAPLVGSKNANLGEMLRSGVPVPPGFAVTTEAYDEYLAKTGAGAEIERCWQGFGSREMTLASYEEASRGLSSLILEKDVPREIEDAIARAYEQMARSCRVVDLPVAVRSSAVAEDLPAASFAGQYDSYLNVTGVGDLMENVKRCWASIFTARAIMYRIRNRLSVLAGSMSVGVIKMVNTRSAGVCFTVHPGTGDDTKILIEANWGTGESVVQGIVVPDRFLLDKNSCTVAGKEISEKLRQVAIVESGTAEREIPDHRRAIPCISDDEAMKIAEYAKKLESHYGRPIDIEWALDDELPFPENIFMVQARPVTRVAEKKDTIDRVLDRMMDRF